MKSGDYFQKVDELSYLIVFRYLSVNDAQEKCVVIAQAASRHLFGEDLGAISIRVVVGTIDNTLRLKDLDPITAMQSAFQTAGIEIIVTQGSEQPIDTAAVLRQPLAEALAPAKAHCRKVTLGSDLEDREVLTLDEITFRYRPIWDSNRKVVLTYLCQPMPRSGTEATMKTSTYRLCVVQNPAEACLLDLHVFREVVRRIEVLRAEGVRIVVACPVHFGTISHSRSWTEYQRALDRAGTAIVHDIVFLLIGFEQGVPNVKLTQEIPKLTSRSKLVFAAIAYREGDLSRFARTGVHAIGMELRPNSGSGQKMLAAVDALALESQKTSMASFVLGVKSRSIVISAIASGVRYLEGETIAASVGEPRHAFVRDISDLYR